MAEKSSFDWGPIVKAMSYTGGIAGALGAGGPEAMTAFVGKIADKQSLKLSQEWEAEQKKATRAWSAEQKRDEREWAAGQERERRAHELRRDEERRTHERGLAEMEFDRTIGEQRRQRVNAHMAAGRLAGAEGGDQTYWDIGRRITGLSLGSSPEDITAALAVRGIDPKTILDFMGKDIERDKFFIEHQVSTADRPDDPIQAGNWNRAATAGIQAGKGVMARLTSGLSIAEGLMRTAADPNSKLTPQERVNKTSVAVGQLEKLHQEADAEFEKEPEEFSGYFVNSPEGTISKGAFQKQLNAALELGYGYMQSHTVATSNSGLAELMRNGSISDSPIVDQETTQETAVLALDQTAAQNINGYVDNVANALGYIYKNEDSPDKYLAELFGDGETPSGELAGKVKAAVDTLNKFRSSTSERRDAGARELILELRTPSGAGVPSSEEISDALKVLSNLDLRGIVQDYQTKKNREVYVDSITSNLTDLAVNVQGLDVSELVKDLEEKFPDLKEFATLGGARPTGISGVITALDPTADFTAADISKLSASTYEVDTNALLENEAVLDAFASALAKPDDADLTAPQRLVQVRERGHQIYDEDVSNADPALTKFEKEVIDRAENKIMPRQPGDVSKFSLFNQAVERLTQPRPRTAEDERARRQQLEQAMGVYYNKDMTPDQIERMLAQYFDLGDTDQRVSLHQLIDVWRHNDGGKLEKIMQGNFDNVKLGRFMFNIERELGGLHATGEERKMGFWDAASEFFTEPRFTDLASQDLEYAERKFSVLDPYQKQAVGRTEMVAYPGRAAGKRPREYPPTDEQINAHTRSRRSAMFSHLLLHMDTGDWPIPTMIQGLLRTKFAADPDMYRQQLIGGLPEAGKVHDFWPDGVPLSDFIGETDPGPAAPAPSIFDSRAPGSLIESRKALQDKANRWLGLLYEHRNVGDNIGESYDPNLDDNIDEVEVLTQATYNAIGEQLEQGYERAAAELAVADDNVFIEEVVGHAAHIFVGGGYDQVPTVESIKTNFKNMAPILGHKLERLPGVDPATLASSFAEEILGEAQTVQDAVLAVLNHLKTMTVSKGLGQTTARSEALNKRLVQALNNLERDISLTSTSRMQQYHKFDRENKAGPARFAKQTDEDYAAADEYQRALIYTVGSALSNINQR